jgi:hypothetical protein
MLFMPLIGIIPPMGIMEFIGIMEPMPGIIIGIIVIAGSSKFSSSLMGNGPPVPICRFRNNS